MFNETFYYETIRKLIIGFGTLFNEVYLVRRNADKTEADRYKVPIVYAPKQKYLSRTIADLPQDKQVAITYPRMSFAITSIGYDPQRKLISTGKNIKQTDIETRRLQYNPVPYIVNIELYIISKNAEDTMQIVERIFPYFTPAYTITINTIPEMGLKDDVPITLKDTPVEDPYEGSFDDRRDIVWTLRFTAKVNFYGRMTEQKVIREVQADLLIPLGAEEITDEVVAKTPRSARVTTVPDPLGATPDDDFGFSTTITEYDDNMKYNPRSLEDEPVESEDS